MNKLLLMPMMLCLFLVACGKIDDVKTDEITVVGLRKPAAFGLITDVKSAEITIADIQVYSKKLADSLSTLTFDLRADGTATVLVDSKKATDEGKYVVSADKKTITYTSNTLKNSQGGIFVEVYEVLSLTATELKIGFLKAKKGNVGFSFADSPSFDFGAGLVFSAYYSKKDPVGASGFANATTAQNTITFKK
jgi:hypothetical protein